MEGTRVAIMPPPPTDATRTTVGPPRHLNGLYEWHEQWVGGDSLATLDSTPTGRSSKVESRWIRPRTGSGALAPRHHRLLPRELGRRNLTASQWMITFMVWRPDKSSRTRTLSGSSPTQVLHRWRPLNHFSRYVEGYRGPGLRRVELGPDVSTYWNSETPCGTGMSHTKKENRRGHRREPWVTPETTRRQLVVLTHSEGAIHTHSEGAVLTHSDGVVHTHSDGPVLTHSDGPVHTHSEGAIHTHSDGPERSTPTLKERSTPTLKERSTPTLMERSWRKERESERAEVERLKPLQVPRKRWHRENEELPVHLRRPEVVRPFTVDQWNQFAWESSQASLVPCENCGRTFAPDRLEVHQRSCKTPLPGVRRKLAFQQPPPPSSTPAPLLATSSLINTCSPTSHLLPIPSSCYRTSSSEKGPISCLKTGSEKDGYLSPN
uniref:C2HC/C3H-type domain-containing protein n=1 Tax=Timema genevievae TaxID=629358 RepID=A0A7R9PR27_TIMGE|nr:unnamed protein product [Timema genevievae]